MRCISVGKGTPLEFHDPKDGRSGVYNTWDVKMYVAHPRQKDMTLVWKRERVLYSRNPSRNDADHLAKVASITMGVPIIDGVKNWQPVDTKNFVDETMIYMEIAAEKATTKKRSKA